jgi:hypothetical protein
MTSTEYNEKRVRINKTIGDIRGGRTTIHSQLERNRTIRLLEKQREILKLKLIHSLTYGYGFGG